MKQKKNKFFFSFPILFQDVREFAELKASQKISIQVHTFKHKIIKQQRIKKIIIQKIISRFSFTLINYVII